MSDTIRTEMTIPGETSFLQGIDERTNPYKRLAAAVISQAVQDATNELGSKKRSAITWLLEDDDGFPFWCNVLGVDPDQAREELSNLLASLTERVYVDFQSLLEPRLGGLQHTMVG
jgi:hypothetical protein